MAVVSLYVTGYSQTAAQGSTGSSELPRQEVGAHNNYTTSSLYYGNNIIAHFKEYTNEDLFTTYPDFPKYQDNGNLMADVPAYKKVVFEWIRNHEEFRKKFNININDLKD